MKTPPINIFAHLLGERYDEIPQAIRDFHNTPCILWQGQAKAGGATHFMANLMRKVMGFPQPSDNLPITVNVYYTDEGEECWTRRFGDTEFSSILALDKNNPQQMYERFGPVKQYFTLETVGGWLCWKLQYCTFLGIKLPKVLSPQVIANEGVDNEGTYQFVAKVTLPLIGTLLEYNGYLTKPQ